MKGRFNIISKGAICATAAVCALFSMGNANASLIDGTMVTVGSGLNSDSMVYQQATVGAGAEITGGYSWMLPGDSIDFYDSGNPGVPNEVTISLDANHVYTTSDILHMSIQLASGWAFDPSATALIAAIDIQVPTASFVATLISNDTLTFDMSGLDQVERLGGHITYIFDAIAPATTPNQTVPEPTSLLLFGVGLAGLGMIKTRRSNQL